MENRNLKIAEMINTLAKTAGTPIYLTTEYLESSIEINAVVHYMTEAAGEEVASMADEGFGGDYSLAFYNNDMIFGIPFEHIEDIHKRQITEKRWFLYVIRMDNGDIYRIGNSN